MSIDDTSFILQLQSGDPAAFPLLVRRYSAIILTTCYRFLLDRQDAEDIAQEVFIEVYQSIHTFRGDAALSTWMYRIAVTKCLDELKKRKRAKRITSIGKMLGLDSIAEWIAGGREADASLREADTFQEITAILDTLPDNQRIAFTLSKIDGYSNAEIADIMKTTTIAVESLIYRAKQRVGKAIKEILRTSQ
ncbi:MAG: RNA polymerase sigma factor [Candidatus Kapaibacterium sp.]